MTLCHTTAKFSSVLDGIFSLSYVIYRRMLHFIDSILHNYVRILSIYGSKFRNFLKVDQFSMILEFVVSHSKLTDVARRGQSPLVYYIYIKNISASLDIWWYDISRARCQLLILAALSNVRVTDRNFVTFKIQIYTMW